MLASKRWKRKARLKQEAEQAKVQGQLNYLRGLLRELIWVGDAMMNDTIRELEGYDCTMTRDLMPLTPKEWSVLRDHMQYAHDNYPVIGGWWGIKLRDGSSLNLPFFGIDLDREAFCGSDYTALTVLIHEPMHDLNREGIGHKDINPVVGPYSNDSYFEQFYNSLGRLNDGVIIRDQLKARVRNVTVPTIEKELACPST